jgi:hypothetical protein
MSRAHRDPCCKRGEVARSFGGGGWSTVQYSKPTVGEQNDATQDQGISGTRTRLRRVHADGHGDGSPRVGIRMSAGGGAYVNGTTPHAGRTWQSAWQSRCRNGGVDVESAALGVVQPQPGNSQPLNGAQRGKRSRILLCEWVKTVETRWAIQLQDYRGEMAQV